MEGSGNNVAASLNPKLDVSCDRGFEKSRNGNGVGERRIRLGSEMRTGAGGNNFRVLPAIPSSSQNCPAQRDGSTRNPLTLNAADSKARNNRIVNQERWRSSLLQYEVALKELVTNSFGLPPTGMRVMKTFKLFDSVTRVVSEYSPEFSDMLKMFRVEFCRAIFSNSDACEKFPCLGDEEEQEEIEELGATYFDQVDALLRENGALRVEVSLGNTYDNLAQQKKEIERAREALSYYENEVNRLERENERYSKSYLAAKEEAAAAEQKNDKLTHEFDDMRLRFLQENKEIHLRLCRLRKYLSDKESVLIKDSYKAMKDKRMDVMQRLFDEGDERVTLLVILSQLESRINECLDRYDKEILLADDSEDHTHQQRMLRVVSLLIEEMHLCEERYLRLLPRDNKRPTGEEQDETDAFITLLSEPRLYEALVGKQVLPRESPSEQMSSSQTSLSSITETEKSRNVSSVLESPQEGSPILTPSKFLAGSAATTEAVENIPPSAENKAKGSNSDNSFLQPSTISNIFPECPNEDLTALFSPMNNNERESQYMNKSSVAGPKPAPTVRTQMKRVEMPKRLVQDARRKQEEWVRKIFGSAVQTRDLVQRVKKNVAETSHNTDCEKLMEHFITKPLLDISTNKFHCGIDLFAGPAPHTQALLCSVMHVDPVDAVVIPQGTRYMHVKHRNPMRTEVVGKDMSETNTVLSSSVILDDWGGKSTLQHSELQATVPKEDVPDMVNNSSLFSEMKTSKLTKTALKGVVAMSSTSPTAAIFPRLNPLSPNRAPEWLTYQSLFSAYRPLTPRFIDIATIGHILLNSCERHFDRAEERYMRCIEQAKERATNSQMLRNMAERAFKDSYVLTEFQESIVEELEARYCYPELVAKTMYELLCYLDATAASQPLLDLYLSCIRGFESPTRIHYITYVLHQISTNWPSSNPEEPVLKEDVLGLLDYMYKRASGMMSMDPSDVLTDYQMSTHSAPITLSSFRSYIVTTMLHYEDPLLLYFNGLLSYRAMSTSVVEMSFEQFECIVKGKWEEAVEGKLTVRYLVACCGFNKSTERTTKELACVVASMWSSHMWKSV
ncbi:hypothetical protein ERJ75_000777700 [Trypanosoma vivax]|uniref:Uncharacterized protein n=1 Tax=Trypanosoma vivax (strain Y486) TaxID=1055687 RepID=G0U3E5_TRYVY|nr:hypothetical protein TRVL_00521 [Trypanosoma vivax]KAH8613615.1 hypothetical protein ERJ75_000777700 [Trypanosoma vivax]CCC50802.1 conserved hypothetical protein [Trypanosoma vivax Y486]